MKIYFFTPDDDDWSVGWLVDDLLFFIYFHYFDLVWSTRSPDWLQNRPKTTIHQKQSFVFFLFIPVGSVDLDCKIEINHWRQKPKLYLALSIEYLLLAWKKNKLIVKLVSKHKLEWIGQPLADNTFRTFITSWVFIKS